MLSTLASLELKANHELHNTRVAGAAYRSESIDVIYGPVRILIQVCDRWIAKAFEINCVVDAVKLRVIEHVEGVCAQLKPRPYAGPFLREVVTRVRGGWQGQRRDRCRGHDEPVGPRPP